MKDRTSHQFYDYKHLGGWYLALIVVAVVSAISLIAAAMGNPAQFAFSYLTSFAFFFTVCVGSLFWVLIHHIVDAEWSVGVRRQLENIGSLFSVLGWLFIPLVFVAPEVWRWMQPGVAGEALMREKAAYLNMPFFWARAAVYFFVFAGLGWLFRSFSVAQDEDGAARHTLACRRAAYIGVIPFAVCVTFAGIDWLMSIDWRWYSAIWGVYIFAGSVLAAICLLAVIVTVLRTAGYLREVVTLEHYHVMGKLILAFTIFWAYIAFSQFLIIWYTNIPEETEWFARWGHGTWQYAVVLLVVGHFVAPFLLLLSVVGKRNPWFLGGVGLWILGMHFLDMYLVVMPILHPESFILHFADVAAVVFFASVLALVFLKRMGDVALCPLRDPRLSASQEFTNE